MPWGLCAIENGGVWEEMEELDISTLWSNGLSVLFCLIAIE